jgi:hypothetical protein
MGLLELEDEATQVKKSVLSARSVGTKEKAWSTQDPREEEHLDMNTRAQIQRAADRRCGHEEEKQEAAGQTRMESWDKVTTKTHTGESIGKTKSGCEEKSDLQIFIEIQHRIRSKHE